MTRDQEILAAVQACRDAFEEDNRRIRAEDEARFALRNAENVRRASADNLHAARAKLSQLIYGE